MNQLISYNNYMKVTDKLPDYISFNQYKQIRNEIIPKHYDNVNMPNKRNEFLKERDVLLFDFAFATGGRITDIVSVTKNDIDFKQQLLMLRVKKSKKTIKINLDSELCYMLISFIHNYNIPNTEPIFKMTRQNAWNTCKKFGKMINIDLRPHMFRHGLALYLLSQGIDLRAIAYRLGHSNPMTTANFYLKMTPEIEKQILENIEWR